MTEDEIVMLGEFAYEVRMDPRFVALIEHYNQRCFEHFMTTAAPHVKEREGIYAAMSGTQDFISHLDAVALQAAQIKERHARELSDDVPEQDIVD